MVDFDKNDDNPDGSTCESRQNMMIPKEGGFASPVSYCALLITLIFMLLPEDYLFQEGL